MAEIFRARLTGFGGLEKVVAVKRILPHLNDEEAFVDMFLDEARTAALLSHPNVIEVFEIGKSEDRYFFSMEYVAGTSSSEILKAAILRGPVLPLEAAVAIGIGAAAGLHHAHERRDEQGRVLEIVHRDISPANILVRDDGCVKVIDFGIARSSFRQHITSPGTIKGKLSYMSPEQCRGERVDRRSDIYSLAVVLWELTTGQRLYRARNRATFLRELSTASVRRPSQIVAGYPLALEKILLRALSRAPDGRHPTAEHFQLDLEGFALDRGWAVSPHSLGRHLHYIFPGDLSPAMKLANRRTMILQPR
jgi:serine/threonine-protein kinase